MTRTFRTSRYLLAFTLALCAGMSAAQDFPRRAIRMVVPYAPGGGTDILSRILAPKVGEILGQAIIIENKQGASTMLGTTQVVRSAPDGYTLVAADSTILINPGLYKAKLPYDTLKSLEGVTMMATAPVILLVNPGVPAKNLAELIALAKASPGKLNFGSGGTGAGTHLAGELLRMKAGIDIMHVPYNGTSPGVNALMSGDIQMMFGGISSARQLVSSGRLRAIAVTRTERNAAMPDVPTFAESGLDLDASTYWGVYAPVGVPKAILSKISLAFAQALKEPDNVKKVADLGYIPIGNTPEEHTQQLHSMVQQWTTVVDKANIKVE